MNKPHEYSSNDKTSTALKKIRDMLDNLEIFDKSQISSYDVIHFIENSDQTRYKKMNIKKLDKNTVEILVEPYESLNTIHIDILNPN